MSLTYKRLTAGVAIAGIAVISLGAAGYIAGARINTTQSIPVGLYWTSGQPISKGGLRVVLPTRGECVCGCQGKGLYRCRVLSGRLRFYDEARRCDEWRYGFHVG